MNQVQYQPVLENDAVSKLSLLTELFFHRLMNVVDRYGCFDARPGILRARLFPLKLDDVTEAGISAWLTECVNAGLIKLYEVNGLPYLQVSGYKRRLGPYKTPYPEPPFEERDDEPEIIVTETLQVESSTKHQPVAPAATETKPEPGKEHDYFLNELFKRENEKHRNRLAERIRQPEIKHSWIKAFNAHLNDEGKRYTVDNDWLERLKIWLPLNVQRLIKDHPNPLKGELGLPLKSRPKPMVL